MQKKSHDSETLAEGKQVVTACAFIHQEFDGVLKVFLVKRTDTKKFLPGVYEIPGGHIDYGENIVKGLKREILEELNMNISVGDPFAAFDYINQIKGSHSFQISYFASFIDPLENIKLHPEDHSTFDWFSLEEIEEKVATLKPDGTEDLEIAVLKKGLHILAGESLDYS